MLKLEGLDSHSIGVNVMRKIEKQMLDAINKRTGWSMGNTSVEYERDKNSAAILLHGNHIATYHYDDDVCLVNMYTFNEWPTRTTKSRLNALRSAFAVM